MPPPDIIPMLSLIPFIISSILPKIPPPLPLKKGSLSKGSSTKVNKTDLTTKTCKHLLLHIVKVVMMVLNHWSETEIFILSPHIFLIGHNRLRIPILGHISYYYTLIKIILHLNHLRNAKISLDWNLAVVGKIAYPN